MAVQNQQLPDPTWAAPFIDEKEKVGSRIARPWRKWLLNVLTYIRSTPQIVAVPVSSTSAGIPGQIAYGGGFFYVCVATNQWQRAVLSGF